MLLRYIKIEMLENFSFFLFSFDIISILPKETVMIALYKMQAGNYVKNKNKTSDRITFRSQWREVQESAKKNETTK